MTISRRSNAPPSRTGAVGHWENQRACMPPGKTQLIGCPKDEVLPRSYLKGVLRVNGSDSAGILARMSNPRRRHPERERGTWVVVWRAAPLPGASLTLGMTAAHQ